MSRRLIVMRHAKSSWKDQYGSDHERPLKGRGRREARRAAEELLALDGVPDRILSSDSARTTETWNCMQDVFEPSPPVEFTRKLYHVGLDALKEEIRSLDDDVQTLLVLGHNPGWEEIVERLTGMTYVVMKTAHMALLDAPAGGWADAFAREGTWKLNRVVNPRGLIDD